MNSGTLNFRCRVSVFTSLLRRHCIEAGKWVVAEMFELDVKLFSYQVICCSGYVSHLWVCMPLDVCQNLPSEFFVLIHKAWLPVWVRYASLFGSDMLPEWSTKDVLSCIYGNSKNSCRYSSCTYHKQAICVVLWITG